MKKKETAVIGVIGGSGLYAMRELKDVKEIAVKTPFGKPSDKFVLGRLSGVPAAFLPRHGRKHALLPGEINQRANMWALKSLGVRTVISASAVGSLREELAPGSFVFPDQFVDETRNRVSTFFGGGIVGHLPLAEPFCASLRDLLYKEALKLGIDSRLGGTYACMEGPGFSTRAESEYHRKMGYSVIGMTVATEARLAREAGLHYVPVSLVTDYDCWKAGEEVSKDKVIATLNKNIENIRRLIVQAVPPAALAGCRTACAGLAKDPLLTRREDLSPRLYKALKPVLTR